MSKNKLHIFFSSINKWRVHKMMYSLLSLLMVIIIIMTFAGMTECLAWQCLVSTVEI